MNHIHLTYLQLASTLLIETSTQLKLIIYGSKFSENIITGTMRNITKPLQKHKVNKADKAPDFKSAVAFNFKMA